MAMKRYFNSQGLLIIVLAATIAGALVYFLNTQQRKVNINLLVQSARAQAEMLTQVRSFYLDEIVANVEGSDVIVTHDFRAMENAIPIPATMTLELSEYLNARSTSLEVSLISEHPYPWRADRSIPGFAQRALEDPGLAFGGEYWELSEEFGLSRLSFATPISMDQGCVDCHNAHPDSPKTDWRVGDVRGVQVVQIPVDALTMNLDFESALVTALIILITFTATIALLFLNHRASLAQTSLQRRNTELAAARERADHASRAKSDFLANMSHEIRTPLNGVIGMMQTVDPNELDPQTRETFNLMGRSARSLRTIVNNILDISKIEARKVDLRKVEFNVVSLLNELADRYAVSFSGEHTRFHLDIDPDVPSWVLGDGDKVEQILSNLISNARKFTDHGEVRLSARMMDKAPVGTEQTTWIRFAVSDTGIGIAPEEAELLFKPFFQADTTLTRNHEGTGLGLAIVRELSTLMGGDAKVDSRPGEGSVFTVDLPFKLGRRSALPVAERAERAPAALVLTQDRRDLHVMTEVMSVSGVDYAGFASPEQARAYWSQWCQSVKHVFVDAQFAGDGAAFVQWMTTTRTDMKGCRFILIGGEVEAARAVGAGRIEKPKGRSGFSAHLLTLGYGDQIPTGEQPMHGAQLHKAPDVVIDPMHVLIVDDNAINRRVLSRLLDQMGMTAETADDAAGAIRRIKKGGIDLVLMDIQMPDMNGYEATAALRARGFHDLEIVACTAHAFEADREKALECGMNGHLAKPVDRQILRNLLVGLSEKRRRRLAS